MLTQEQENLIQQLTDELWPHVDEFVEDISEITGYRWCILGMGFHHNEENGKLLRYMDVEPEHCENNVSLTFSLTDDRDWVVEITSSYIQCDPDDEEYDTITQQNVNAKAAMFAAFGQDFLGLAYHTAEEAFESAMECTVELLGAICQIEADEGDDAKLD